jgi:hypothetical protein
MHDEILGFPTDFILIASIAFVFYGLFLLSPIICSVATVIRGRSSLNRRFLYITTVTLLSYGFFLFAVMALYIPAGAFFNFIAPTLHDSGHLPRSQFLEGLDFVVRWWGFLALPVLAIVAFSTNRYLAKRWNGITVALQG